MTEAAIKRDAQAAQDAALEEAEAEEEARAFVALLSGIDSTVQPSAAAVLVYRLQRARAPFAACMLDFIASVGQRAVSIVLHIILAPRP